MKKYFILLALPLLFSFVPAKQRTSLKSNLKTMYILSNSIDDVVKALLLKNPSENKDLLERGVKQASALWTATDGDADAFKTFCLTNYVKQGDDKLALFNRLSTNFEILIGHFNKMSLDLKKPLHLDEGEILPIDEVFGSYDPYAHLNDDFFDNQIAFAIVLNFPFYTLEEKKALGVNWTRSEWAYAKIGDIFTSRVPAKYNQLASEASTASETYISEYNIYMGNLIDAKNKTYFPADLKLITHWGLRDELKSHYADADALDKQNMIYAVMKNIITQDIPVEVINKNDYLWNPYTNKIYKDSKEIASVPEKNKRYQVLLDNFNAMKAIDTYSPQLPTFIKRKFDGEMQLTQEEVEKLFIDFLSSPVIKNVAKLISTRLKRKLQPYDIWYDGFKARSTISSADLDKAVKAKYPTKEAFVKNLPEILAKVGFAKEKAAYITSKIEVDASRGAGHAWGAEMKTEKAHLRTRVGKDGMDYKGYNIAVHEFGHNVEQTLTLYDIDYYMLRGVPNTAFTEAIAFMFQQKDLELLGIANTDVNKKHLEALDNFWSCYEIMGVSLVDMAVWKWLYAHPEAKADELKVAVISISKEVWNKYYADVFGVKDEPILAIYSHMINSPLYLSAYPVGHLIDFQISRYVEGKVFADEIQRMLAAGSIVPQLWMKNAVGSEISAAPMISAAEEALKVIKK